MKTFYLFIAGLILGFLLSGFMQWQPMHSGCKEYSNSHLINKSDLGWKGKLYANCMNGNGL
ncbi:hypothetical protein [Vibrio phage CKB-S2]|nr:hypothetical protein [Vibrio phage CKB-S2]